MDVPKISWTLVHAQLAVLSAIGGATGAWCTWRQIYKRRLEREGKVVKSDLENHHPDEARHFMQYGYRTSRVGYAVMHCWTAALMVGYVLVVVGCWIGYAIFADLYFPPSAEYWRSIFESWDGVMFPWCVVFVLSHLLLGLVLIFWDAIKSQTMLPATSMREATHLMIQEVHDAGTGPLSPQGPRATTRRRHHRGARSPSLRERCGERCAALSRYLKRVQATEVLPICSEEGRRYVEHMCVRYTYCDRAQSFVPAGQLRPQPSEILKLRKRGGLSEAEALQSRERSGPNAIHVRVPGRLEALVKEFSHFTYIFNSFGVWIYIGYTTWNIGLLWLLMTLGSGLYRALGITRPNQKKVANLARVHQTCSVLREGKYKDVDVTEIALGDIVQVNAGRDVELPCDGLLISGSLIVNESMLTGEPMPVAKTPIESDEIRPKSNKVFAGTRVLESEGLPEDQHRALVYCTEVGALTTRGSLVRMVLFPASVRFKYTEQLPQVYGIMCLYACVLILLKFTSVNEGSWVVKFLNIACCLVGALNPMLPVSLVMGQSASAKRLTDGENYQIKCLQPGRIPIAGKISTMVFDKTGTITKSSMDLAAVHPIADAQLLRCQRLDGAPDGAFAAGEALWRALRRCHTVKQLQDGRMVGNELECAMLRRMREMGDEVPEDASVTVRELEFDHQSMTSGVVLRRERDGFLEVFLKGSPEKIKAAARASSCPSDYDATVTEYAKANYYTIGVSHKMLPQDLTHQEVCALAREELEKEADLVGLLLFQNEMKAEAPEAIRQLKEGNVRSVICTGDSALTGIAIGRQCGIVEKPILHAVLAEGQLRFSDEKDQQVCDPLDPRYQLALSCSAWRHLCEHEPELLQEIWPRCVVFGRMKPVDKINVIKLFQRQGLIVGMAGDGGNDCGALRAAHAGLALSTAEASLVAPFSTGRQEKVSGNQITLITVPDLIREGRACLATNLATFSYFIIQAFSFTSIFTIAMIDNNITPGEWIWLIKDIFLGILVTFYMTRSRALPRLKKIRPTASLLGYRTVLSIASQVLLVLLFYIMALFLMKGQEWYDPLNPVFDISISAHLWMLKGDNYDGTLASVFMIVILANCSYIYTYGGDFRKCVLHNLGINVTYLASLTLVAGFILAPPNPWNCIFRVSCDAPNSVAAGQLFPFLQHISVGGVGKCFLGPQVKYWQQHAATDPPWLPSTDTNCLPPAATLAALPLDDPRISTGKGFTVIDHCVGPNNCLSVEFQWILIGLLSTMTFLQHFIMKFVFLGPVAQCARDCGQVGHPELAEKGADFSSICPETLQGKPVQGKSSKDLELGRTEDGASPKGDMSRP